MSQFSIPIFERVLTLFRNEGVLDSMVPAFPTKLFNTVYDWNYTTAGVGLPNRSILYPRGRILGGSSSHSMYYSSL